VTITWSGLAAALLWGAVAALATWFVLTPLRRRSTAGLLASLVLVGAAASMGAFWGAIHTMIVPHWDWAAIIALSAFSAGVTALAAIAVGRRLAADNSSLRLAVGELRAGRVPSDDGRRLTTEVEQVRRELRATAADLATTRERERALESSRRELVSWVSHDLRTPLAGLRAMAEALEDGVVENPELYYKQIGASVDRLNQMVEDLFDLSRIQAGAASRDTERIALTDLTSDCISALEPLAAVRDVRLLGEVRMPVTVRGNGRELNRAVTNLLANAIRHTADHGRVDVRVDARPSGSVEVAVRDECGGIAPEHLARVFDVGFRAEAARTPSDDPAPAGAGWGLAITRGIVEAHGGTVSVRNVPGGCEFTVRLPSCPDREDG
jgi:signal transduction histidine kinase